MAKAADGTVWVLLGEMIIDESYQGRLNRALVAKIAKDWRDDAAVVIVCNRRSSGEYAVLDGQHRVLAATAAGVRKLQALVFTGKTVEEEARLFTALNTRHAVRPMDRFKADLRSGAKREVEIDRALRDVGLQISDNNDNPDCVRCVGQLSQIYGEYGIGVLRTVAFVLTEAFNAYPERTKGYSVAAWRAVAQMLHRYPDVDIARLVERMREKGPIVLHGMADANTKGGADLWIGYGKALTTAYNTGTKTNFKNHLPMSRWDVRVYTPAAKVARSEKRKSEKGGKRAA